MDFNYTITTDCRYKNECKLDPVGYNELSKKNKFKPKKLTENTHVYCTSCKNFNLKSPENGNEFHICAYENECNSYDCEDSRPFPERPKYIPRELNGDDYVSCSWCEYFQCNFTPKTDNLELI